MSDTPGIYFNPEAESVYIVPTSDDNDGRVEYYSHEDKVDYSTSTSVLDEDVYMFSIKELYEAVQILYKEKHND